MTEARSGEGRSLRALRAAGLYAAALSLFFLPAVLGLGDFMYRDAGRMHGAHKRLIAEAWSHGEVPAWNPFGGLGFPLIAGAVDAPLHPFNALLVLFPYGLAMALWVLASALLAALGMRAWALRLGTGEAPALAAGFALALGGYLVSSTDNFTYLTALASVPLLLAAGHRFAARGGASAAAALAP
ncbi:MAG TPA: hypothetical protein VFP50_14690, partial [Anaeromyxobacteraceae bacterium]|nr:hypothetical protein [Anaeromyxobacteraceae bacterium]